VLRRDLAGHVSSRVLVAARGQQVDLGAGYVLQEIQPPARFFGRSIGEIDVARAFGVQIVLLRERAPAPGRPAIRVPTADDVIHEGDRLVVAGRRAAVESLDAI
jgi:Trk K+ transport system NAD-binding subunit